jgi:hypothetical protein
MLINGFGVVIQPVCVMLCQICGWGMTNDKNQLRFAPPHSKPKSYEMTSIEPINSMLIHTNIS